jgi:hypothetical protein
MQKPLDRDSTHRRTTTDNTGTVAVCFDFLSLMNIGVGTYTHMVGLAHWWFELLFRGRTYHTALAWNWRSVGRQKARQGTVPHV